MNSTQNPWILHTTRWAENPSSLVMSPRLLLQCGVVWKTRLLFFSFNIIRLFYKYKSYFYDIRAASTTRRIPPPDASPSPLAESTPGGGAGSIIMLHSILHFHSFFFQLYVFLPYFLFITYAGVMGCGTALFVLLWSTHLFCQPTELILGSYKCLPPPPNKLFISPSSAGTRPGSRGLSRTFNNTEPIGAQELQRPMTRELYSIVCFCIFLFYFFVCVGGLILQYTLKVDISKSCR